MSSVAENQTDATKRILAGMVYYHGTSLCPAVAALTSGDPIKNGIPTNSKTKFPSARRGRVYLSPHMDVAAHYAMITGREDWPEDVDDEKLGSPHVFIFEDFSGLENIQIDEDDIGWIAMNAARQMVFGKNFLFNTNHEFCFCVQRVANSIGSEKFNRNILEYLLNLSERIKDDREGRSFTRLAKAVLSRKNFSRHIPDKPAIWTRLGISLGPLVDVDIMRRFIKMGANISVTGEICPTSYIKYDVTKEKQQTLPIITSKSTDTASLGLSL